MIVKVRHENGTPLVAIVGVDELTGDMRDRLALPHGDAVEDYSTFEVRRNKRGEITRVSTRCYSDAKAARIDEQAARPTLIDALKATYRHDGRAVGRINRAADDAGIGHAEARRVLEAAFTPSK